MLVEGNAAVSRTEKHRQAYSAGLVASAAAGVAMAKLENLTVHRVDLARQQVVGGQHLGRANVLFCDTRIESNTPERWTAATPEARRRWNIDNEPHEDLWSKTPF